MRALVVDDSSVMRKLLVKALSETHFSEVDEVDDGEKAILACETTDYDLILMDNEMPNVTGIEATRDLRSQGKDMPIVMMISESEKKLAVEAAMAGVQKIMVRPFDVNTVTRKINAMLNN